MSERVLLILTMLFMGIGFFSVGWGMLALNRCFGLIDKRIRILELWRENEAERKRRGPR